MSEGREVWPPGSHDINPFDYLKCGVSRRSSHKKNQSLITTIKEFFSNIPREATKMACSRFLPRLEKVVAVKGDFICEMKSPDINKQFVKISSICCYF
jgi:hypothetical protein